MTPKAVRRGLTAAVALLIGLGLAASASAQGMFYKEIAKDGRIYVFNDAKRAETFEKGGDMGVSLTRVGVGPNGETVVADSEQALDLFFFKHGIAEAVVRPEACPCKRSNGATARRASPSARTSTWRSRTASSRASRYQMPDDSVQLPGTAAKGDSKGSFRIRRAKRSSRAGSTSPSSSSRSSSTGRTPPARRSPDSWRTPTSTGTSPRRRRSGSASASSRRPTAASSSPPRVRSSSWIAPTRMRATTRGRETGLALWGTLGGNKLDWRAMVSNGNGRSQDANDNAQVPLHGPRHVAGRRQGPHEPVGLGRAPDGRRPGRLARASRSSPSPATSAGMTSATRRPILAATAPPPSTSTTPVGRRLHLQVQGLRQRGRVHIPRVEALHWRSRGARREVQGQGLTSSRRRYAFKAPAVVPGARLLGTGRAATPSSIPRTWQDRQQPHGDRRRAQLLRQQAQPEGPGRLPPNQGRGGRTRARGPRTKEFRLQTQFIF